MFGAYWVKDDLRGLVREVKDVLGCQIKQIEEMEGTIEEMKGDIKDVIAHQTEMERRSMPIAESIFRDCGKKK